MTLTGTYIGIDTGVPTLEDIALGLSRMPRFGGQTLFEWTVADHVVCATRYLGNLIALGLSIDDTTRLLPLHVLLHDAHEAMTGDIPTTFKTADMKALQHRLDARLYNALGLWTPTSTESDYIKQIDRQMLLAEAKVCTPATTYEKICEETKDIAMPVAVQTIEEHIHDEIDARAEFLELANQFMGGYYGQRRVV
jgi:5'-deoxynucleotidase YfbR-like HD superfamily hydrolase